MRSKREKKTQSDAALAPLKPLASTPLSSPKLLLPEVKPTSLKELLALSPEELERCDIARINLLCAEGLRGSENLDVEHCLKTLDAWTAHVESETKRNFHHFLAHPKEFKNSLPYFQMGMLGTVLAQDLRIQYNPARDRRYRDGENQSRTSEEWNEFFSSSTDVFIHGLLTGKHFGTCSSMPFLYAAIGRRLGYPVTIAARKLHLYVRYDAGDGTHLNIEATENLGFSTPTDAEYRNGPFPMTQEEIDGLGWLRPLNNKEILSICLSIRAASLRSMKRYDEETETWQVAARYGPDTAFKRRVNRMTLELTQNLKGADRWDELADELRGLLLPTTGPMSEHFRNRQLQVQLFMNQSTNLAEIEQTVAALKQDLRRYQNEVSDSGAATSIASLTPAANEEAFLALLENMPGPRRVVIPEEAIPHEYRNGVPPELYERLRKLTKPQEVVEEMQAYAAEEMGLRNFDAMLESTRPPLPPVDFPLGQKPKVNIKPEDLPLTWRGRQIPEELQERLAIVNATGDRSTRESRTRDEINRFFIDQDQRRYAREAVQKRRMPLDQQPQGPPLQIQILSQQQALTTSTTTEKP